MQTFKSLFDTRIVRLLFHKEYGNKNWVTFIDSILKHEPEWEESEHLIITPNSIRLEVIGTPMKIINTELENMIQTHQAILAAYRTEQDRECDLLDGLMQFCGTFYENHPLLSSEIIKNRTQAQFDRFSRIHGLGSGFYELIIGGWVDSIDNPLNHKECCKELAWDAVGRFMDICRPQLDVAGRNEISQKRDLSLFKGWAVLLKNHRRNLSAYRIVSRICERDNTGWGEKLRPAKGLSLFDDVGDPDVVHSFVFGDFTYEKKTDSITHYSVIVFIRMDEALVLCQA